MVKLTDQYSWKEIGEMFADRIEKDEFIEKKEWQRHEFIEWFNSREKLGLRFDWRLVARAFVVWKSLHKEHDHFTVVVGPEGSGKTTLIAQYAAWISPQLDLNDLVFNMPGYIKKLQEASNNYKKKRLDHDDKSIVIDEGGISLFSRESLSLSNKLLAKTFMVQRFLNVHVGICIPHYWSLDNLIRNHRVNTLLVIKKRGDYKAFVGKGIKILNKLGAKDKEKPLIAIPIPYGYFWEGNFHKDFPETISKRKYENYKFKHIQNFLEEAKMEADTVKMVKVAKLEKEFGLKRDVIVREIQNDKIEGRKIGSQWFITKKAYEKLIMAK